MSLATDLQSIAGSAIKSYGAAGTLTHSTPGVYDPVTGGSTPTVATSACVGIIDASSFATLGFKFGADLVRSGDYKVTVPNKGLTFAPTQGDGLSIASRVGTVIAIQPVYVMDQVVTYELLVRGT